MTLDEAVATLEEAGFVADKLGGTEQRILAGTSRVDADGADVYKGAFSVFRSEAGWSLVIAGPDQTDTTVAVASLEAAVAEACARLGA
jgi:hypothetical protein